jgi:hypothetical protein
MDSMDNFRERFEALEQQMNVMGAHTRMVERRLRWWRSPCRIAAVIALGFTLVLPLLVHAETFQCGAGDVQCLIDAINAANANGQKNTIRLEAGTYTLTAVDNGDPFQFDTNGLPVITSALTITGAGAATTSIERGVTAPDFRLVHVAAAGTLTLRGLTLSGGGFSFGGNGGGIRNNGTLTLSHSTLSNNRAAGNGGGLFNDNGDVTIINSTVAHNSADNGGGIASGGTLDIAHSTITDNLATSIGGLGFSGTARIDHSTVARNTSRFNAGGIVYNGTLILTNSTIADNSADFGGIQRQQRGSALIVTNTTFSGNFLVGLHLEAGTAVLINTTFARNGQGLANDTGQVILVNTILASNVQDCTSRPGPFTSLGDNLIGDPAGCTITLQASDLAGDPGLDAFTDDGMPGNGHFPLLPTSQAIDAGNDAVCPRRDQLGQRRINIRGVGTSICDIGAIEFRNRDNRQHDEGDDEPDADLAAMAQESQ